jgi:hypothetical protein
MLEPAFKNTVYPWERVGVAPGSIRFRETRNTGLKVVQKICCMGDKTVTRLHFQSTDILGINSKRFIPLGGCGDITLIWLKNAIIECEVRCVMPPLRATIRGGWDRSGEVVDHCASVLLDAPRPGGGDARGWTGEAAPRDGRCIGMGLCVGCCRVGFVVVGKDSYF